MEGDIDENNDHEKKNILIKSINSDDESIKLKDPGNFELNDKKCFQTPAEICFALTFFGRIVMTLYSFHGLFFIYNFIIQFILLIPGRLYDIDSVFLQVVLGIFYILFALVSSNLLVIPTYEFLLFPYLNFRNPFAHLHSLLRVKYVMKDQKNKLKEDGTEEEIERRNRPFLNYFLITIGSLYFIGLALSLAISTPLKDYIKLVILFVIYSYYTTLFIGYIVISIYICFKLLQYSCCKNPRNKSLNCWRKFNGAFDLNAYFGDPEKLNVNIKINPDNTEYLTNEFNKEPENQRNLPPLPRLNLFSYSIHPILLKSYKTEQRCAETEKKHLEDNFLVAKNIFRLILFIYAFFLVIIDLATETNKKEPLTIFFFIIFFFMMIILSMVLNFPICCRNKKTFGLGFCKGKVKLKPEYKMRYPNMVSFVRLTANIIITLSALILFGSFYAFKEENTLEDLHKVTLDIQKTKVDTKSLLLPNICFSSIHHIPIYLFLPFINDAYYYNDKLLDYNHNYFSSFHIPSYKDFFYDETYSIDKIRSLINGTEGESVKMIQYNVRKRSEEENEVTILSIKGTSNKKDVFIDFQLYFPSILLSLLSAFSIQGQQKSSLSFKFIEYSLSLPYRVFFQYSLVQSYLKDLKKAYIQNLDSMYKNVIIVGHSLGGGLAKLLGRLLNRQAVSLSGPGVNAFHSLWGYEGYSENFELSAIDLVPDMDLVPRVEVSGGTVYRIFCKEGPFGCHGKETSLCEVLIMCRNPNYYTYCSKLAGLSDERIKELYESSEMNYILDD